MFKVTLPAGVREVTCFLAGAGVILAVLFRDAWLHGYVLGQGDILFDFLPWESYRPAGWRVRNALLGDIPTVFYPFIHYARTAVSSGHFPLWSSAIGGGQPFFAAFQSAVLSPFTLLDYVLPFPASLTADVAARLLTGGVGMYLFLRGLPVCGAAAAFGGLAFLLNAFSVAWLEHPLSAVAAWLPWLLLAVERCVTRGNRRSVAGLAVVTALTLLSGHPETAFKLFLLAGSYAVYRGAVARNFLKSTTLVVAAMLLGAVLCSVQILPFLEYARESRILAARSAAGGPMYTSPLAAFATAFVPDFYGSPLRHRFVLNGTNYCEMSVYPGIVTWVFAAIALMHDRHRGRAIFFLVAAAFGALIMYGTPVARAATLLLPPLRVAALSRFGLITITGIIVAAAIGVDAMCRRESYAAGRTARLATAGAVAAAAIAAVVLAFLWGQHQLLAATRQWSSTLHSAQVAGLFLMGTLTVLFAARRLPRPAAVAAILALLTGNLLASADGFHPLMPRAQVFPELPELRVPQQDSEVFRIGGWIDTLLPNTAMVYGLQDFRGYDGIGVRHYADLLDVGFRFTGSTHQLVHTATPHLIDLLNVKYVLAPQATELPADRFQLLRDGPTRLYLNLRVQPRAFLVDRHVVLTGNAARRAMRDSLDLTRVAVLDEPLAAPLEPQPGTDVGLARIRRYENELVSIATRADGRRLLVLSDVYYPGWVVTIDGTPAPIHRADYAFRAVSVPAGEHLVEFRYRPASFRYGLYGSAAGGLILTLLLIPWRKSA